MICSAALDPAPLVTHRLPLSEFDRGVALVRQRAALKVLFTPDNAEPSEKSD
jgi:threonine dehydrogenase-like Zn-dependent dehydrogenase